MCEQLVGDYQAVSNLLPESLDVMDASPGLKNGILSQARADLRAETPRSLQGSVEVEPVRRWRWPNWFTPMSLGFAAAMVVVVAALGVWNVRLQSDANRLADHNLALQLTIDDLSRESTNLTELVSLVVSGADVSTIPGTDQAPNAIGALIRSIRTQQSVLIVDDLRTLPGNQRYQIWQIADGTPISAGTFSLEDSSRAVIPLDVGFSDTDILGVSIEPAGGSESPTGDIVILGPLQ